MAMRTQPDRTRFSSLGGGLALVTLYAAFLLGIHLLRPLASAPSTPAPNVTGISPAEAYNDRATTITIFGSDFFVTISGTLTIAPAVTLGDAPLAAVTFVSSTTLTTTVPSDWPAGVYTITVTNPDGQSASLASAFTVLLASDGTLDRWRQSGAMNIARYFAAAAAGDGHVYVLGGDSISDGILASVEKRYRFIPPLGD